MYRLYGVVRKKGMKREGKEIKKERIVNIFLEQTDHVKFW